MSDDTPVAKRPPLNGARLVAAIPMFAAGEIDHYVIAVVSHTAGPASAMCKTLDDTEWYWAHYKHDVETAVRSAYLRAQLHVMPWAQIEADMKRRTT